MENKQENCIQEIQIPKVTYMASNPDITIRIIPIEQSKLEIELNIYESLLKLFYDSSDQKYDSLPGELEFDINKFINNIIMKITVIKFCIKKQIRKELEIKLKEHETKAPITKPTSEESM